MTLSSGLLFSIAITYLIPEALAIMVSSSFYIILGFGIIFLFQQLVFWRRNKSISNTPTMYGVLIGMIIHTWS